MGVRSSRRVAFVSVAGAVVVVGLFVLAVKDRIIENALIARLSSEDRDERLAAVRRLESVGSPRAVVPLVEALAEFGKPDGPITPGEDACLDALQAIVTRDRDAAFARIDTTLESDEPETFKAACFFVGWKLGRGGAYFVPALATRAGGEEVADLRTHALVAMARTRAEAALPHVIQALGDKDRGVRTTAAQVISWFGPDGVDAIPALVELLAPDDDGYAMEVGHYVSRALGAIGPQAVPALIRIVERRNTKSGYAASALADIGPGAAPAVPALIELTRVHSAGGEAIQALGKIGAAARPAMPAIKSYVERHDHNSRFQRSGLEALKSIVRASAASRLRGMTSDNASRLVELLREDEVLVRWAAVVALGDLGSPAPAGVVSALAQIVEDRREDTYVRREAAEALGRIGSVASTSVPALVRLLKDRDTHHIMRRAAAEALGAIDVADGSAVPALVEIFRDRSDGEELRWIAMDAIEAIGPVARPALPRLIDLFRDRSYEDVERRRVAEAIASIGPEAIDAAPVLVAAVRDDKEVELVRHAAAETLAALGPSVVPLLTAALADARADVRLAVVEILVDLGADARLAIPALRKLLLDPDAEVRDAAGGAIESITEDAAE